MRHGHPRWPLLVALAGCALFQNFWLWSDHRLVAGIPSNLAYHLSLCVVAAAALAAVVRWGWPGGLDG